jgi:eukaryotic-like serine/threonine-protein kinase
MGEVYQAHDSRLGRSVAVKMLPDAFAQDPERISRLEREAKLLASLNHPNIAALYGMDEADGTHFLIMELVEGETLAERIQRGPIPAEEAFRIAHQIAGALEAAHEQGVIHRDLKPANVKITPDGKVKVLDFGLAKAIEVTPAPANSNSPTLSALATNIGIILGTAGYMSPEQARGHAVDQRSDVFSFGCVLYEMLTGRQPFPGETVTDIIASVVARDPDWRAIPSNLHPKAEELIRRCLAKNRKDRYHAIADVRVELEAILADPHGLKFQMPRGVDQRPLWRRVTPFAITAVVAAAMAFAVALVMMRPGPSLSPIVARFPFVLPEDQVLPNGARNLIAISPDGSNIVYLASGQLQLKTMGELQARPIAGTAGQSLGQPFFSPDGRWVGFFTVTDGKLKKIALTGGAAVTISDLSGLPDVAGGVLSESWGPDDQILIGWPGAILRVSANGGKPEKLITLKDGEAAHGPQLLPGGDAVLFTLGPVGGGVAGWDKAQIVVQSLKSGERKVLVEGGSDGRYSPTGHIVYTLGTTLLAVPFDLNKLEVTGGPAPIVEGVRRATVTNNGGASAHFAFSANGSMAFVPSGTATGIQAFTVALVDRTGARKQLDIPPRPYNTLRVSPDGKQLALSTDDGSEGVIWVYGLDGTAPFRRLTFDGRNSNPIWTKDGRELVFTSERQADVALFRQAADGSGSAQRLFRPDSAVRLSSQSWSPDGKTLIFILNPGAALGTVMMFSPGSSEKAMPLIARGGELNLSPDGRWLAYQSNESGRMEVYIQPFPTTGAKYQVTIGGGSNPLWSPDGKQLFHLSDSGALRQVFAMDIQTQPNLVVGKTTSLPIQVLQVGGPRGYDITPDGKYFVVLSRQSQTGQTKPRPEQINVTLNWFEELKQRVPVK